MTYSKNESQTSINIGDLVEYRHKSNVVQRGVGVVLEIEHFEANRYESAYKRATVYWSATCRSDYAGERDEDMSYLKKLS